MPHPIRCVAALVLIALGALAGCSAATPGDLATDPAPAPGEVVQLEGSLTVLAAASLTEVFRSLGTAFEAVHPAVEVTFSFGGSSALATQVEQGAPADVLASASQATMDLVVDAGAVLEPVPFATNAIAGCSGHVPRRRHCSACGCGGRPLIQARPVPVRACPACGAASAW